MNTDDIYKMKRSLYSSICIILLGVAIWWMAANVVWLGDDLDYKYMMRGEIWQSWGKIRSVKAFFESQLVHYQHVNGRFVAHSLVQLFNAYLGQPAFAICNAIVYSLFALSIAKVGNVSFKQNPQGILSAISIAVLFFITKMMPTCQIGYIWGMLVNILWLFLFFRKNKPSWPYTISMSIAGIIVGNWQESISLGVCSGVGVWWFIQAMECIKSNWSNFDWRRSWILAGCVAGTASNCLAPSTIGRTAGIVLPIGDQLMITAYSLPAVIILIVVILTLKSSYQKLWLFSFSDSNHSIPNGVIMIAMIALICFNAIIGIYSNRQLFGANLFASILILRIIPKHRFCAFINAVASVAVIAFWILMIKGIEEVRQQYDEIVKIHKDSEDGSVYIDRQRVLTLGFPLRAKYYEDILGQFDNDIHHSMMKDFKHVRKGRTLKIKPTLGLDSEKIEKYAPGHFNVTLKEPPQGETPREVIVYGHYFIPALKSTPRKIKVTNYSKRRPPYGTTVIIPEFPFFTADSLEIIPQ